jgi:perosamine synthetase
MKKYLPVAEPVLNANERAYVLDCLDTNYLSWRGSYVGRFEAAFASLCATRHAVACINGTAALHLACLALGIGPGDEVILPSFTYVSTANAVLYCGGRPVFCDCLPGSWCMDVDHAATLVTERTRAIVPVHMFGQACDMDAVARLAKEHGLAVIEDAAQAHGSSLRGRPLGSFGDLSTFSFFGSKTITTGEGGMVLTSDDALADSLRCLINQGGTGEDYVFDRVGYNYRMTNITAAIGLGQAENMGWHCDRKRTVAGWYARHLDAVPALAPQQTDPDAEAVPWVNAALLPDGLRHARSAIIAAMDASGIQVKPFFHPVHRLEFMNADARTRCPVTDDISGRGIILPSGCGLDEDDVRRVCRTLAGVMAQHGA